MKVKTNGYLTKSTLNKLQNSLNKKRRNKWPMKNIPNIEQVQLEK